MPILSLTNEKIDELNNKYEEKKKIYMKLLETNEITLWKEELNIFIKEYKNWIKKLIYTPLIHL